MEQPSHTPDLVAKLTPWFTRRMAIMLAMFVFFAAYFAYDWKVGYPKKALIYKEYLAQQQLGEEGLREWANIVKEKGYDLEDEKTLMPAKIDDGKIAEQFYCMVLCALLAAGITVHLARALGTTLEAGQDSLKLPHSAPIAIASIVRVDTRKWLNKGLAYVWYKNNGKETKGVIDGLKYGGFKGEKPYLPDQILERVVTRFQGELIELQDVAAEPATAAEDNA
jgi:hypothetical protein